MIKQWTDKDMLEFARIASGGSYGDYKGCKSLTSKLKKYKLMSKQDKVKIEEVLNFLTENEQYGDNWKEHIKVLDNLLEVWDDMCIE